MLLSGLQHQVSQGLVSLRIGPLDMPDQFIGFRIFPFTDQPVPCTINAGDLLSFVPCTKSILKAKEAGEGLILIHFFDLFPCKFSLKITKPEMSNLYSLINRSCLFSMVKSLVLFQIQTEKQSYTYLPEKLRINVLAFRFASGSEAFRSGHIFSDVAGRWLFQIM